jgi:hypothetical protein
MLKFVHIAKAKNFLKNKNLYTGILDGASRLYKDWFG